MRARGCFVCEDESYTARNYKIRATLVELIKKVRQAKGKNKGYYKVLEVTEVNRILDNNKYKPENDSKLSNMVAAIIIEAASKLLRII